MTPLIMELQSSNDKDGNKTHFILNANKSELSMQSGWFNFS